MTTAQTVSEIMGGDGQVWTAPDGRELSQVCEAHGGDRVARGDMDKYDFADGSTLVLCGGGWDLGFVNAPDDCYCWPEANHGRHNPHCPHGEAD